MANQIIIDIGAVANDGTGDPLRTAFGYVNDNFANVWATGVANSNVAFSGNRILTVNTNGNLVLAPNGTGKVVANVDIVPNTTNSRNLGALNNRWSTVYSQYLNVSNDVDFTGDITVGGNLVVTGDIIEMGNIVTDAKTIQLANTAGTANAANGSGITVGASDNIATLLYNSSNNVWATNIGANIAGNVTAPYFFGNASQMTGLPVPYSNADVSTYLASGDNTANIITTGNINGAYINGNALGLTSLPAAGGPGELQYNNNGIIDAAGLTYIANTRTLYGVTGSFVGQNANTGINALYAGVESFTVLGTAVMAQFTGNVNSYSQINFQNISNSVTASGDYIITSDNGTDTTHFINLGITGSGWDGTQLNSLGNRLGPNDGYLYVQDGNLVIGTSDGIVNIWKFGVDGNVTASGNLIPSADNTYSLGNATNQWSDLYVSNATIYMNNIPISLTSSNVLTVDGQPLLSNDSNTSISTTGNITADYFIGNGSQLTGITTYTDSNVTTLLASLGANTINGTGNITTTANISGGNIIGTLVAPATTANTYILYNDSGVVGGSGVFTFNENGNVLTVGTTGGQLRVADIGTPQAGVNLRFIPSSGTTLSYGNLNPQFANTYDLGQSGSRWNNMFANAANIITTRTTTLTATGNISGNNISVVGEVGANTVNATGEITSFANIVASPGGYFIGDGSLLTGLPASYTDSNVTTLLASLGSNTISGTGNITTTANISGGYVLGNAAFMTGIPASYGNANVADFLDSLGSNAIVTTGNITGGNLISSATIFGNPDIILGNVANASATKTRMVTDTTFSYIQTGNGTVGSTGNIVFAPYSSSTQKVVIDTASGNLTAAGNVTAQNFTGNISITGNVTGTSANVTLVAGSYSYTFDNTGILTLPAPATGNEGGEIAFTQAANSTLSGNTVVIDQYVDRIRFFESGGNTRGAYIDFTQAADGVGTLLNNRVSGIVDAGTFVTMDLLKATVTTSGNRGLSLAATTGSFSINISGTYGGIGGGSGSAATGTINTTPSTSQFGWNFTAQAEGSTYIITDTTNNRAYRITLQIGGSFLNNLISIERLI